MTPAHIEDEGASVYGGRLFALHCACGVTRRRGESLAAVRDELVAEHRRWMPLCQHLAVIERAMRSAEPRQ
jgi:hypothetical protein